MQHYVYGHNHFSAWYPILYIRDHRCLLDICFLARGAPLSGHLEAITTVTK